MAGRPEFCREAKCPLFTGEICNVNQAVIRGWPSVKSRGSIKGKLLIVAQNRPNLITKACSEYRLPPFSVEKDV